MALQILDTLERDLEEFGAVRFGSLADALGRRPVTGVDAALLAAVGHEASGLRNVVRGRRRGLFGLDASRHRRFLGRTPGCASGQWRPSPGRRAIERGHAPALEAAADYVVGVMAAADDGRRGRAAYPLVARLRFPAAVLDGTAEDWPEEALRHVEEVTARAAAIRMRASLLGWQD